MERSSDTKPWLRKQDVLAAGVVLVTLLCVVLVAGFVFVETQFGPSGSAFGRRRTSRSAGGRSSARPTTPASSQGPRSRQA